ncbi:MAG: hypothetical protein ACKVQA_25405 [Burkholderiales bacterium]
MNPLMRYDALMLVGREKAAQAICDEVVRGILATVPVREEGPVIELHWCPECRERRKHLNLDSGEWVCFGCTTSGEDSI